MLYAFQQCKTFENRLRFDKLVSDSLGLMVRTFESSHTKYEIDAYPQPTFADHGDFWHEREDLQSTLLRAILQSPHFVKNTSRHGATLRP